MSGAIEARVAVQAARFDTAAEIAALDRPGIGGLGCFVGIVRGQAAPEGGAALAALTLEHYPGMTERAMRAIAATAVDRYRLLGCTVIHRVGRLAIGEPIVLVLAASAHRAAALEATSFLIDWLKTRAPFWKREEFEDGGHRWVEARAEDDHAAGRWDVPAA